jgi:hypothetical protein
VVTIARSAPNASARRTISVLSRGLSMPRLVAAGRPRDVYDEQEGDTGALRNGFLSHRTVASDYPRSEGRASLRMRWPESTAPRVRLEPPVRRKSRLPRRWDRGGRTERITLERPRGAHHILFAVIGARRNGIDRLLVDLLDAGDGERSPVSLPPFLGPRVEDRPPVLRR